jgi:hypothetical protein
MSKKDNDFLSTLYESISNSVQEYVKEAIKEMKFESFTNTYINQKQLMETLGIGMDTLKELHRQGLKSIKLGKQRLYDINDVKEIMNLLKA